MKTDHDERWLHDIDPPLSDRKLVVAMFVCVCLFVILGVTAALHVREVIADKVASATIVRAR